jgi:hypothetical protein
MKPQSPDAQPDPWQRGFALYRSGATLPVLTFEEAQGWGDALWLAWEIRQLDPAEGLDYARGIQSYCNGTPRTATGCPGCTAAKVHHQTMSANRFATWAAAAVADAMALHASYTVPAQLALEVTHGQ